MFTKTFTSPDGSTTFVMSASSEPPGGGGGMPHPGFPTHLPFHIPAAAAGFGIGTSASAGPGGHARGTWCSATSSNESGPSIAMDTNDQASFARVRILECMARNVALLDSSECATTLVGARRDLCTHWPVEWSQQHAHQELLTSICKAAGIINETTDPAVVRSTCEKVRFPHPSQDTKVTYCLRVILGRLVERTLYSLAHSAQPSAPKQPSEYSPQQQPTNAADPGPQGTSLPSAPGYFGAFGNH